MIIYNMNNEKYNNSYNKYKSNRGIIMKEVESYTSVIDKLQKRYPDFFYNLVHDFIDEYNIETGEEFEELFKQMFYGWIFLDYQMFDGKRLIDFCYDALDLTNDQILMLEKIKNAKRGMFEIKRNSGNMLKLTDVLTKESHNFSIIDFELKRGIIKANLVYNLEGNLFLFGGVQKIDKLQVEQYMIEEGF